MTSPLIIGTDMLAQPPITVPFHMATANFYMVAYGLPCVVIFLWSWITKPKDRAMLVALFIAGALTSACEPLYDVASGCFHPMIGQNTAFTLMGRGIPVWVMVAYTIFYGVFPLLMIETFNRGIKQWGVWAWFILPLFVDLLIEIMMVNGGLYTYYGNQALVIGNWPFYQGPGNSTAVMLGTTVLFFLQPVLKQGWRWFPATIILLPMCSVMGWCGVGFPSFYAVHSTWPNWAVQLCGLSTCALASLFVYAVSVLVSVDSPLYEKLRLSGLRPVVGSSGVKAQTTTSGGLGHPAE